MDYRFINKHQAADLLGVSVETLKSWRKKGLLRNGVHYSGNDKFVRYNQQLLLDWLINRSRDPEAHERAVDNFLASLASNQKGSRLTNKLVPKK